MQRAPAELCATLTQQLERRYGALARNALKQRRGDEGVQIRGISDAGAVGETPANQALIIADETEEALAAGERRAGGPTTLAVLAEKAA